jgi:hypothetical protein
MINTIQALPKRSAFLGAFVLGPFFIIVTVALMWFRSQPRGAQMVDGQTIYAPLQSHEWWQYPAFVTTWIFSVFAIKYTRACYMRYCSVR